MNDFGVSIDGLWTLVNSEQSIKSFLFDAENKINNYTINKNETTQDINCTEVKNQPKIYVQTCYQFLPI